MPIRLFITPGEPAGIGPDVCLQAAFHSLPVEAVLIADKNMLQDRLQALDLSIDFYNFDFEHFQANGQGRIAIHHIPLQTSCQPGKLDIRNSASVLECLNQAHDFCLQGPTGGLITGPIHKAIINQAGIKFSGHTEYLADLCDRPNPLMTFHTPEFILGLATTHIPLQEVTTQIQFNSLKQTIHNFEAGLKHTYKITAPKMMLLGLNPHAGEKGVLGKQEQQWMNQLVLDCQQNGINICGPFPADTAFTPGNRKQYDGILALYHDQGLTPIKALYFEKCVNITLGLNYLRTSVDHGTALDLAATGKASPNSFKHAFNISYELLK